MHDIVYILKNDVEPDELRYSLRSVSQNWTYDRIWFYGGCPEGIKPDKYISVEQKGRTSWERVSYTLAKIFRNEDISENFWLFNDDFYIIHPLAKPPEDRYFTMVNGTMEYQVKRITIRNGGPSKYTAQLKKAAEELRRKGYDTLNYAMHIPLLINRKKGLEVLNEFPRVPMFRCLYGNKFSVPCVLHRDVKLVDTNSKPDPEWGYLSTSDGSFRKGNVGKFIKETFTERCKYEISL